MADPITQFECRAMVMKHESDLYGNGKLGLIKKHEALETAMNGDSEHDGYFSMLRSIDERTRATEEYRLQREAAEKQRPAKVRGALKDWIGMINLLFLMAMAIFTFLLK